MAIMKKHGATRVLSRTFRNASGGMVDPPSFSATDAKNSFGVMMDTAMQRGIVTITKRDHVRAVLLSIEQYDELMARVSDPLATLQSEFDALVAKMQTPTAKRAARNLFKATPKDLGGAAVKAARRG